MLSRLCSTGEVQGFSADELCAKPPPHRSVSDILDTRNHTHILSSHGWVGPLEGPRSRDVED